MSEHTKISWTNRVWNPVSGCSPVSEGCRHCYASRMAKRLAGRCGYPAAPHQFDVTLHPERLDMPLKWKKPCRVFVDSMSDLFHEDVPDGFISGIWMRMMVASQHTFQILTKRPERMATLVPQLFRDIISDQPTILPNLWLGASVENQQTADERIPWLLKTPAVVRFVSVEPMLGPVDLWKADYPAPGGGKQGAVTSWPGGLDWVICGCESGPGARPMNPGWARNLKNQCQAAGTPFFLKQMSVDGKRVKMPELDGRVWDEFPG